MSTEPPVDKTVPPITDPNATKDDNNQNDEIELGEIDDSFLFKINEKPKEDKATTKKDDEDIDLEDIDTTKKSAKQIEDATRPIVEKQQRIERELEVNNFLNSEESKPFLELKGFKQKFTELAMKSESHGMKPAALAYAVAGKSLLKLGAKMATKANSEAQANTTGGGTVRPQDKGGLPDTGQMSRSDFIAFTNKVKQGSFKAK